MQRPSATHHRAPIMFLPPRQPHLFLLGLLGCTLALPIPALANTPWTEVIEDAAFAPPPAEASAQPTLTLFPKRSATLRYMGLFPATMTLQRQKDQYEITMTATIPFRKMVWRSVGTVVNNQLRPALF
nr:hypothetical protein [Neisseriaceae bacterium]